MASIVLGSVGKIVGGSIGGPVGAFIGARVGQLAGGMLDQSFIGGGGARHSEGARLEDLAVQTSTYGRVISRVFGSVRIAGNVIWARPIREYTTTTTTRSSGGKGGGGRKSASSTQTSYSYSATLAIAICEGPIDRITRIWADAKLLSLGQLTMRIYTGTQTQLPDPLIESYVGPCSAHRGLAYVVIEDFPLADFGNRVPNFTFEVVRNVAPQQSQETAESLVRSLILIPGSGEHVYDTVVQSKTVGEEVGGQWVQRGNKVTLNMHNIQGEANVTLALDQMQATFPNLEWVGLVVNWFGSHMDAASCIVEPCVEFPATTRVSPDEWEVAGYSRAAARVITHDGGSPRYGGTPSDSGVVRLIAALKARGMKVFFYPMMLMDLAGKPWRGELTGSSSAVSSFFTKTKGYNAFITHYAHLVGSSVDAFAIGSELRGLTSVTSSAGVYPAVTQLVSLAGTVKGIVGSGVKVTYAADWSEYHHADGGWYHLDPLWASPHIDMVGIDAYFPLTDAVQTTLTREEIIAGWTSGEGFDWYYTDPARTTKASLAPAYAWKNLAWWWNNAHTNPNGSATAWVPQSKKIWFTEYGFASVDGTTNEPNRFVDPTAADSAYPRFSRGRVDFAIQRMAIEATEEAWAASAMVERLFLWTWDARPYPQWPDLTDVWADGLNWAAGHWVQGKLGGTALSGVVRDILLPSGLGQAQIDSSALTARVEGYVIAQRGSAREALAPLMSAYPFDLIESAGVLKAVPRGGDPVVTLDAQDCVHRRESEDARVALEVTRAQELELPREIEVVYLNRLDGYNAGTQRALWHTSEARAQVALKLPLVLSDQAARLVAQNQIAQRFLARTRYRLRLPLRYAALEPGDVIALTDQGVLHRMRLEEIRFGKPGMLEIAAVAEDATLYDAAGLSALPTPSPYAPPHAQTLWEALDIPALPGDRQSEGRLRFAALGDSADWPGCSIAQLHEDGEETLASTELPATLGYTLLALPQAVATRWDMVSELEVSLLADGVLASATEAQVLGGANAALVGEEVIQFTTATLLAEGKYRLSRLLRGRLGTEDKIAGHVAGERFVPLDNAIFSAPLRPEEKGRAMALLAMTFGDAPEPENAISFTPQLRALMPYAPVHLSATRSGGGDITLNWVRRARLNHGLQDDQDIPLMEADERYDVEILSGATVLRSVRTASPTCFYSAAQQTADFGGPQASLSVRVYQLSALVGRGVAGVGVV